MKRQGSSISTILSVLVILPFLNQVSVHALLRSGSKNLSAGGKDAFYRTKNRQDIDWRGVLTSFVKRFLTIVAQKGDSDGAGPRCLALDDSYLPTFAIYQRKSAVYRRDTAIRWRCLFYVVNRATENPAELSPKKCYEMRI